MTKTSLNSNYKEESRLFSELGTERGIFFSLATMRNDLFFSNDPGKVLEFYSSFNNVESIIDWLENRPKGRTKIIEIDGNNDCIVVIPTANHNNVHSQRCKDEIFTGMHIIFVESGNFQDPFFSFSHSCNVGLRKAMEYGPTFIVWTNDDMLKIDESDKLRDELNKISNNRIKAVFAQRRHQVSTPVKVVKFSLIGKMIQSLIRHTKLYYRFVENFDGKANFNSDKMFLNNVFEKGLKLSLYSKFHIHFLLTSSRWTLLSVLFTKVTDYMNFDAFGIIKSTYLNNAKEIFDENLIVQHSDQDFSLRFGLNKHNVSCIDYSIQGIGRSTIKDTLAERLRNVVADIYIDYKIKNNQYPDLLDFRIQ